MQEGVPPVLLELAQRGPQRVLERGQVGLVVEVGLGRPATEPGQPGPHTLGREVLDLPVVLVAAGVLARGGDHEVADRAQAVGQGLGHGR